MTAAELLCLLWLIAWLLTAGPGTASGVQVDMAAIRAAAIVAVIIGYLPFTCLLAAAAPWLWYNAIAVCSLLIGAVPVLPVLLEKSTGGDWRAVDDWFAAWYRRKKTPGVTDAAEQVLAVVSAAAHLAHARQTGDDRGGDWAIDRARKAVTAHRNPGDPFYGALSYPVYYPLLVALVRRYEQVHARDSLEEAITLAGQMHGRWWLSGPACGPVRRSLSQALRYRYERDGDIADLVRAAELARAAVASALPWSRRRHDYRVLHGVTCSPLRGHGLIQPWRQRRSLSCGSPGSVPGCPVMKRCARHCWTGTAATATAWPLPRVPRSPGPPRRAPQRTRRNGRHA